MGQGFPTFRRFLTLLQQADFEITVAKGEMAHNEPFHLLPQCYSTLFTYYTSIYRDIPYFDIAVFNLCVCRKGLTGFNTSQQSGK